MATLSVKECLSVAWKTFRARPWLFIGAGAIIFFASMVADFPRALTEHLETGWLSALKVIAFFISIGISFLISMGKTAFFLRAHDSVEKTSIHDLWHPTPFLKFVGTSVLAGAATVVGLLFLIVPGIIIGIMFGFAIYITIEKGTAPIESLKESAELTKGNRWNLCKLGLAILGMNILGFLALIVGLAITLPLSTLAVVHAYRVLSGTVVKDLPRAPSVV